MRPLLTTSGLAVMLLCAIAAAAADVTARTPTAPLLVSAPASTTTTEIQDRPRPSDDPSSGERRPARFVDLWVVIVGAVGLLLLVQMVRIERSWRRRPDGGDAPQNESRPGGE